MQKSKNCFWMSETMSTYDSAAHGLEFTFNWKNEHQYILAQRRKHASSKSDKWAISSDINQIHNLSDLWLRAVSMMSLYRDITEWDQTRLYDSKRHSEKWKFSCRQMSSFQLCVHCIWACVLQSQVKSVANRINQSEFLFYISLTNKCWNSLVAFINL